MKNKYVILRHLGDMCLFTSALRASVNKSHIPSLPQNNLYSIQLVREYLDDKASHNISEGLQCQFLVHWLPVQYRVIFKILLLVYKALHANVPPYISDLLTPKHIGCYSLRSNEQNLLIVPKTMRKTFGDRAFAKAGPFLWNELPADIREASTVETFKSRLQTFLFKKAFYL